MHLQMQLDLVVILSQVASRASNYIEELRWFVERERNVSDHFLQNVIHLYEKYLK